MPKRRRASLLSLPADVLALVLESLDAAAKLRVLACCKTTWALAQLPDAPVFSSVRLRVSSRTQAAGASRWLRSKAAAVRHLELSEGSRPEVGLYPLPVGRSLTTCKHACSRGCHRRGPTSRDGSR